MSKTIGAVITIVGIIVVLVVMSSKGNQAQKQNFIHRPDPTDPHPWAVQLPRISQALSAAKSQAEDNALAAIEAPRRPIRHPINLSEGRRLYGDFKAAHESLIAYLQTGLTTRFAGIDVRTFDQQWQPVQQKLTDFLDWARKSVQDRPGPIRAGAAENPLKIGFDGLTEWLNALQAADERAIEQLKLGLQEFRLASWDELTRRSER